MAEIRQRIKVPKKFQKLKTLESLVKMSIGNMSYFLDNFGTMEINQFERFVKEQYLLSITFPQALAAAYSIAEDIVTEEGITPRWEIGKPLVQMLELEYWGRNQESGRHSKYFLDLIDSLGIPFRDVIEHQPYPETVEFVEERIRIVREYGFENSIGAIALGNEYANSFIFQKYLEGARKIKERTGIPINTNYFEMHVRDEISDYERLLAIVKPYMQLKYGPERIRSGMDELLVARDSWYCKLEGELLK